MRWTIVLVGLMMIIVAGCEDRAPVIDAAPPATAPTTTPGIAMSRPATAPATRPATTRATTGPATTQAASRPRDPLATPDSTVSALLELAATKGSTAPGLEKVIPMLLEPPPDQVIADRLNRMRRPLYKGGKWDIMDSKVHGAAAVVIYRIHSPSGGVREIAPFLLMERYGRWKIILGEITTARYTEKEKNDVFFVVDWGKTRVEQLQAQAATAASQPAASQPTSATSPASPASQP